MENYTINGIPENRFVISLRSDYPGVGLEKGIYTLAEFMPNGPYHMDGRQIWIPTSHLDFTVKTLRLSKMTGEIVFFDAERRFSAYFVQGELTVLCQKTPDFKVVKFDYPVEYPEKVRVHAYGKWQVAGYLGRWNVLQLSNGKQILVSDEEIKLYDEEFWDERECVNARPPTELGPQVGLAESRE